MAGWSASLRALGAGVWGFTRFMALVTVVQDFGADFTLCMGPSMLPTMREEGEVVLVHKRKGMLGCAVDIGDVVLANMDKTVCKRIAGMPGDTVRMTKRVVMQHHRDEKTGAPRTYTQHSTGVIPPGYVWLMGDNTRNSTDSRTYGPVPLSVLEGKVVASITRPKLVKNERRTYEEAAIEFFPRGTGPPVPPPPPPRQRRHG